jgi:putative transcriptional regulator
MESFAINIKEVRNKLGWSQEYLAREVGVSLSTVQRWEKSGTSPSRLALKQLQRVMKQAGVGRKKGAV